MHNECVTFSMTGEYQLISPLPNTTYFTSLLILNVHICCSLNLIHLLQLEISHISQKDVQLPPESRRDFAALRSGSERDV